MSKLKDEIQKKNSFESLEQEASLNVQRTADALLRQVERLLKPAGLSPAAYNVLRILRGADAELACGEIAERMISREPDMTRLLDRLETRGLIARRRDTRDRRVVHSQITDAGRSLLSRLDEPLQRLHREQLAHMDEHRLRTLIDLLEEARQPPAESGPSAETLE